MPDSNFTIYGNWNVTESVEIEFMSHTHDITEVGSVENINEYELLKCSNGHITSIEHKWGQNVFTFNKETIDNKNFDAKGKYFSAFEEFLFDKNKNKIAFISNGWIYRYFDVSFLGNTMILKGAGNISNTNPKEWENMISYSLNEKHDKYTTSGNLTIVREIHLEKMD